MLRDPRTAYTCSRYSNVIYTTQCGPKLLGRVFLKSKTHEEDIPFLIQNKLHWYIYTGFCAVVQFLKSRRKFLLLTLAEINLESTGGNKGL